MAENQDRTTQEQDHTHRQAAQAATVGGEQDTAPTEWAALVGDTRLTGRGNAPVRTAALQRMQQTAGNRAVQRIIQRQSATAPPTPVPTPEERREGAPAAVPPAPATAPQQNDENNFHRIANDITGAFEGGRTDSLQTADDGIISYGRHQATLASGSLGNVLQQYVDSAQSATAQSLRAYMQRVQQRDATLRTDRTFLGLLRTAAAEPTMSQAQDAVFSANYWAPTVRAAQAEGVQSALGHAILYDTRIQGGHADILARTQQRLGGTVGTVVNGQPVTEQAFLRTYIEEREARLERLAVAADQRGRHTQAAYLRSSTYRTRELRALVDAGNLDLHPGPDGNIAVHGRNVPGLTTGATVDRPVPPAHPDAPR